MNHFAVISYKVAVLVVVTPLVIVGQAAVAVGQGLTDLADSIADGFRSWFFGEPEQTE